MVRQVYPSEFSYLNDHPVLYRSKTTMMTPDEMIAIIQAYKEGKKIQFKNEINCKEWKSTFIMPAFDFFRNTYRIKPEPKEIWVNEYQGDLSAHSSPGSATKMAGIQALRVAIHYREVIPNE